MRNDIPVPVDQTSLQALPCATNAAASHALADINSRGPSLDKSIYESETLNGPKQRVLDRPSIASHTLLAATGSPTHLDASHTGGSISHESSGTEQNGRHDNTNDEEIVDEHPLPLIVSFGGGAAFYELRPESKISQLPQLTSFEDQSWTKPEWQAHLKPLQATGGSSDHPQRSISEENRELRETLRALTAVMERQANELSELSDLRKSVEQAISCMPYTEGSSFETSSSSRSRRSLKMKMDDDEVQISVAISVNAPRSRPEAKLHLPSASAFTPIGALRLVRPPVLDQERATWDQVFPLIRRPKELWGCWKPSKPLGRYSIEELWSCWTIGEPVLDSEGTQIAKKPPLRSIEGYFGSDWRPQPLTKNVWALIREIPAWIETACDTRSVTSVLAIRELEEMRQTKRSGSRMSLNALVKVLKGLREQAVALPTGGVDSRNSISE